ASISPTSRDFGSQRVGTTGTAQTFTITNAGTDTLNVTSASIGGTDAAQYTLAADTCSGKAIAAGGQCTVDVKFAPNAAGSYHATLHIVSDDPVGATDLSLAGTGIIPGIAATPPHQDFGSVQVGTAGAPQTVTVTNTGSDTL